MVAIVVPLPMNFPFSVAWAGTWASRLVMLLMFRSVDEMNKRYGLDAALFTSPSVQSVRVI